MFLQLQTLRRHVSRPFAAGVSLSLKDVAASQYVCSRRADDGIVSFCRKMVTHLSASPFFSWSLSLAWFYQLPLLFSRSFCVRRVLPGISKGDTGSAKVDSLRVAHFMRRLFSVAQRLTPNLFVDKVVCCTPDLQMKPEDMYSPLQEHN